MDLATCTSLTLLGDLALTRPSALPVMAAMGLDACCGGRRPLAEACAEVGLDPAAVLARLAELPEGPTAQGAPVSGGLAELMTYLEDTHHAYTRHALATLGPLAAKVAEVHGERHPELPEVRDVLAALAEDLHGHLHKEEQILFPFIRGLEAGTAPHACFGTVASPISVMEAEHEGAGAMLETLRRLTREYAAPGDACASYRALLKGLEDLEADLHRHIHLENHVLHPRALALEAARA